MSHQVIQVHELLQRQKLLADALRLLQSTVANLDSAGGVRCAATVQDIVHHAIVHHAMRCSSARSVRP